MNKIALNKTHVKNVIFASVVAGQFLTFIIGYIRRGIYKKELGTKFKGIHTHSSAQVVYEEGEIEHETHRG